MGNDLMELNVTELSYIYFETGSYNTNIKSNEDFMLKNAYFIIKSLAKFKLLKGFQSEASYTGKHIVYFKIRSSF